MSHNVKIIQKAVSGSHLNAMILTKLISETVNALLKSFQIHSVLSDAGLIDGKKESIEERTKLIKRWKTVLFQVLQKQEIVHIFDVKGETKLAIHVVENVLQNNIEQQFQVAFKLGLVSSIKDRLECMSKKDKKIVSSSGLMYKLLEYAIALKKYKFVQVFYTCISENLTTKKLSKSAGLYDFLSDAMKPSKRDDDDNDLDGYEVFKVFGDNKHTCDYLTRDHKGKLLQQAIHHSDGRIFQLMTENDFHNDIDSQTIYILLQNAIDNNKYFGFSSLLEMYSKTPDDKDIDGSQTHKIHNFYNLLFLAIQIGKCNFVNAIIEDKFIDLKNSRVMNKYIRNSVKKLIVICFRYYFYQTFLTTE